MNRLRPPALCLLLSACGHSLWPTTSAPSPVPVSASYACVDSVSRELGYRPFQAKPAEGFLRTRKLVTETARDVSEGSVCGKVKLFPLFSTFWLSGSAYEASGRCRFHVLPA